MREIYIPKGLPIQKYHRYVATANLRFKNRAINKLDAVFIGPSQGAVPRGLRWDDHWKPPVPKRRKPAFLEPLPQEPPAPEPGPVEPIEETPPESDEVLSEEISEKIEDPSPPTPDPVFLEEPQEPPEEAPEVAPKERSSIFSRRKAKVGRK